MAVSGKAYSNGLFQILDDDQASEPDWTVSNGLVVPMDSGAVVLCSRERWGLVSVAVEAYDRRPAEADDPDGTAGGELWDDIVEISIRSAHGPLLVENVGAWIGGNHDDLPRLDTTGPGWYRLRVHTRHRDVELDSDDDEAGPADEFRLVVWPDEEPRPPLLIRLTDRTGYDSRLSAIAADDTVPDEDEAPPQHDPGPALFDIVEDTDGQGQRYERLAEASSPRPQTTTLNKPDRG